MDKKTKKLLKEYNISESDLSNHEASIVIDVTSCRSDVFKILNEFDFSIEEGNEDSIDGKEFINITGNLFSIFSLLSNLESHYGSIYTIGLTAAITGAVVYLSIPEARKKLMDNIKSLLK